MRDGVMGEGLIRVVEWGYGKDRPLWWRVGEISEILLYLQGFGGRERED